MAVVLKQDHVPELPEGLVKPDFGVPSSEFQLIGEGWGLKICISIRFDVILMFFDGNHSF